jgi:hypothetical protein
MKREEIYSKLTGSRDTKRIRVNELIQEGLVSEERKWVHNIKLLKITPKGIAIAELADNMINVLEEIKT